jgi:ABC-type uncharacterized transport system auxiliary subunit
MTPRSARGDASCLSLACFTICALLTGCQSAPPAPADRYYRLVDAPARDVVVQEWTTGSIEIRELRADGPYLDRAILFTYEGQSTHLESYNYDHWIYPPAYLIQQHMVRRFRESRLAPTIVDDDRGPGPTSVISGPTSVISGRILRFEQSIGSGTSRADVELELQVANSAQGATVFRKTYRAAEPATDNSMDAFAQSMGRALERIYAEFSRDLISTPS